MIGAFLQLLHGIAHLEEPLAEIPKEVEELREHDPHYGMNPWHFALLFGIISGLSLPIAACLGIMVSPVDDEESDEEPGWRQKIRFNHANREGFDKVCALMMAFGAGALLFAVATELYGHALHQVDVGGMGLDEMFTIIFGALVGGAFYLTVNQALDNYLCSEDEEPAEPSTIDTEKGSAEASETSSIAAAMRSKVDATAQVEHKSSDKSTGRSGKDLWAAAKVHAKRTRRKSISEVVMQAKEHGKELGGRAKAIMSMADSKDAKHSKSVAYALFLGLLVDGVPEGILMGFLCAEGHLTPALIISLFVANFPEAFSSSSLLKKANIGNGQILGMWAGLCLLVGCLAGAACGTLLHFYPHFGDKGHGAELPVAMLMTIALVEGITGGAMIACIASVMLPEAFAGAGKTGPFYSQSGFLCLAGFLMSASMKATFG